MEDGADATANQHAYKYNTVTNSYTQLKNIPFRVYQSCAVAIGTDVYLLGSFYKNYNYAYKYNTLTDSYTKLTNIPYGFYLGSAVAIDTDIYLFGSQKSDYEKYAYKYDTLTGSYTKLMDIPYNFYGGSAVAIDNLVYLIGSLDSTARQYVYVYNISENTYNRLTDIPYVSNNDYLAIAYNSTIFIFTTINTFMFTYKYFAINYTNNTIYILKGFNNILLNKMTNIDIYKAFIYKDDKIQEYPCYYGDGEKWNLIEE